MWWQLWLKSIIHKRSSFEEQWEELSFQVRHFKKFSTNNLGKTNGQAVKIQVRSLTVRLSKLKFLKIQTSLYLDFTPVHSNMAINMTLGQTENPSKMFYGFKNIPGDISWNPCFGFSEIDLLFTLTDITKYAYCEQNIL